MARLNSPSSNFADCLTISEAADFLGVSTATLRNWDRSGNSNRAVIPRMTIESTSTKTSKPCFDPLTCPH